LVYIEYIDILTDIVRYLEYLAFRYPKMLELITIGHSYEGQPIKMAKVSTGLNKDGERKPAIWIDAGEFFYLRQTFFP